MKFILTSEQQESLLRWAGENVAAEAAADIEPSGYRLEIAVSAYGVSAKAVCGTRQLELGGIELAF